MMCVHVLDWLIRCLTVCIITTIRCDTTWKEILTQRIHRTIPAMYMWAEEKVIHGQEDHLHTHTFPHAFSHTISHIFTHAFSNTFPYTFPHISTPHTHLHHTQTHTAITQSKVTHKNPNKVITLPRTDYTQRLHCDIAQLWFGYCIGCVLLQHTHTTQLRTNTTPSHTHTHVKCKVFWGSIFEAKSVRRHSSFCPQKITEFVFKIIKLSLECKLFWCGINLKWNGRSLFPLQN